MLENIESAEQLKTVAAKITPFLKEGTIYHFTNVNSKHGVSYRGLHTVENGVKLYDKREEVEIITDLNDITEQLPVHSAVKFTLEKGKTVKPEVCSLQMLLDEIFYDLKTQLVTGFSKVETQVDFNNGVVTDVTENWTSAVDQKVQKTSFSYAYDLLNSFSAATGQQINSMYLCIENDVFTVQSAPAIPGLTAELVEEPQDLALDTSSLPAIYSFLESLKAEKIALGLEALKNNPVFYTQAEKRYLNFVRVRLNDPAASLERFVEAALTKQEVKLFLGRHFAKDTISFSYFNDDQARLAVDFIGSIVKNAVDIDAYIAQTKELKTEEELVKLYDACAKEAKKLITKEAKISEDGWFGEISRHLIGLKLKKFLLNKTEIEVADSSPVMKEFMFFLNINGKSSVYIDVFQSEAPRFTEMFWMLRAVPDTSWGDVSMLIPDSPLKFPRKARYDLVDGYGWETLSKPKIS